ncbi:4Fe-4S dicluster domain-containing protein [Desulforhopalus singaporensis]|uniref:Fe-S-cluster-containing dehydrogenase component n=1 Tax=Desulforhopalus singaporensis TaxID=91360 RepID=A0A1H0IVH0_9BACT|nr:4Fe-4S dicluster domain-containing protein [Desulforhopalus singaporensis]SDO35269.1 Fe-S-cluster-containing dehydrogenase component [Desulforhopalus singaporensis]
MNKYAFIIDVGKCENCNNCFLACKDEHCDNDWPGYSRPQPLHGHRWMNILKKERGVFPLIDVAYLPKPCFHCDDAPCVSAGRGGLRKREDGIVIVDSAKACGNRDLVSACPHGALWWNEEEKMVQKCTFCAHLLDDGWQVPRCVQACPTGALSIFRGSDETLREKIVEQELQPPPDSQNRGGSPRCFYRNLQRYTSCFLAGSVGVEQDGVEECGVGARVVLKKENEVVAEQLCDEFGDFRFDGLAPGSGEYLLEISYNGKVMKSGPIRLSASRSAGTFVFSS